MSQITSINHWTFKSTESSEWMPANVPGCVHTDLLRQNLIAAPFYGTNEHDLQWIDKKDWEYKANFVPSNELLSQQVQQLCFHGLDTYAEVFLNNEVILDANNMFRKWNVDVTGKLLRGENELRILFRSPIQEDLPKLRALGYQLPASNDQSQLGGLGEDKVSIFARKAPYHYGWDWGPRFVTSGIWRPVELLGWSGVTIEDVYIEQAAVNANVANLQAHVTFTAKESGVAKLTVATEGMSWQVEVEHGPGTQEITIPIAINQPKLWWSRGLGEASRYTFKVELVSTQQEVQYLSDKSVITGLRSVKLVRERDEQGSGASFYFELNGVPVFAKGANHIPNDSFITEVTEDRYRAEVVAAAAANMNMLRVWGGGVYEPDVFYDLCDEYGIMVWQDFMFACSMYPGDEAFLENVRQEAIDNVMRLRNHPSIVLWCGNNEIDSAWAHYDEDAGWGWKKEFTSEQRDKLWNDYENIFHRLLPEVVGTLHATVDYWPSSPLVSLTGDQAQHSHPLTNEGDIHYWGVWHNVEPFENYQIKLGRFMSEYGFQSFPEYKTIRSFAEEDELEIESTVMLAHQKNGNGNRLIKEYMDDYMKHPLNFKSFLYLSQVLQADAMKMAIEAHRRSMPYCMGTLYWQMNDCWPVASWSGIDYFGRWKALHYYAKRSFAPILLSTQEQDGQLQLYIVSDHMTSTEGKLTIELYTTKGKLIHSEKQQLATPSNTSQLVSSFSIEKLLNGHAANEVVFTAVWEGFGGERASCEYYFVKNRELKLHKPAIVTKVQHTDEQTIVTLSSDTLAKQVQIVAEQDGVWSDNYFDLIPGRSYTISFMKFSSEENTSKLSAEQANISQASTGELGYIPALSGDVTVHSMIDHAVYNEYK